MVAAAHAFGLTVVAEGVESQSQLDLLEAVGVDRAQGYLFARPTPGAEVFSGKPTSAKGTNVRLDID